VLGRRRSPPVPERAERAAAADAGRDRAPHRPAWARRDRL